ncbi:MAG TPA: agarase [Verrucomicrobiae bacterium]|jgi:hypothetical protein
MRARRSTSHTRRRFLADGAVMLAGALSTVRTGAQAAHPSARVFTLDRRGGRWWFITPEGAPFFSIALNHIDDAPLRYEESESIWRGKYANSRERWLKEAVAPDLRAWGFNSVGWTQEVVVRGETIHRHSPPFTFEEYQWLGLPYCHLLPFSEIHQWEAETRHPDFFSKDFEDWCDYVARSHCGRMAGDPKLMGYFYCDCPTWVHTRPFSEWKGPLFDPAKLKTDAGRAELTRLAARYYQVTHDAVRRYDKRHLILGDRYEANAPLPDEVLAAAKPFVDVFSFQHFGEPAKVKTDLARWHGQTGKPVLYADGARSIKAPRGEQRHDPKGYAEILTALREVPGCVGMHLCGAYLRNRVRQRGLRDEQEKPDSEAIEAITEANRAVAQWVTSFR